MWLAYLNEGFMIASAVVLGLGWRAIRKHRVHQHRRYMLTAAFLGACFFVSYVVKTLVVGDSSFGGPRALSIFYQVFLQTHATLATVAGILGIITIRYALRSRFRPHRRVAPYTASLWLIAAASGLVVFLMLYVVYPTGPTMNVIKAMFGH